MQGAAVWGLVSMSRSRSGSLCHSSRSSFRTSPRWSSTDQTDNCDHHHLDHSPCNIYRSPPGSPCRSGQPTRRSSRIQSSIRPGRTSNGLPPAHIAADWMARVLANKNRILSGSQSHRTRSTCRNCPRQSSIHRLRTAVHRQLARRLD